MAASAMRVSTEAANNPAAVKIPIKLRSSMAGSLYRNGPVTVAESFHFYAQLMQHGEHNVGGRRPVGASHQNHRHAFMIVDVRIAHGAAVQNHGMVQQIAVAIRRVLQFLEEIR